MTSKLNVVPKRFPHDEKVFADLDPEYREMMNKTAVHLANGRWWNLWHTVLSVNFMKQIIEAENHKKTVNGTGKITPEVLFPAIIFHDSGWDKNLIGFSKTLPTQITPEDVNTKWDEPMFRSAHMDVGQQIASRILRETNYADYSRGKGSHDADGMVGEIIAIVATHDNVYVPGASGPQTVNERIHRDADACFIVTGVSFWKDYKVYVDKQMATHGEVISPGAYIEQKVQRYGKRETTKGNEIFAHEVGQRKKEIADENTSSDYWYNLYKRQAEARNKRALSTEEYIPTS